mmetsp:Transcript_39014/g.91260  ORF Transcript_39014/g.91260 Transcript_39014/m.91260 type:complete len:642 (+) Transcript_39014:465-2390(+)
MHRRELGVVGVRHEDVEALALVDESAAVGGHVDQRAHLQLPAGLVERLEIVGDLRDVLDRTIVRDDLVADVVCPQALLHEVAQQVLVDDGELAGEHAPRVDVRRVRLEALVVAEDLRGRSGGHGREEQRVAHALLGDLRLEGGPIPSVRRRHAPHVVLQHALAYRRALVRLVRAFLLGEVTRAIERRVVDGLEDLFVDQARALRIERQSQVDEGVGEALHAKANRPMAKVGALGLLHRVEVLVDDAVEVARHVVCDLVQLLVVKNAVDDKARQRDGREVAHGNLVRRGVLDDLRAQVGRANGAQVLLVGLAVGRVLVQHVRRPRLDLRVEDGEPQLLRGHRALGAPFGLVLLVQRLELGAPHVAQPRRLVGAEEAPIRVRLDTPHEEIGHPQRVEEVARTALLLAVVLAQVEEGEDVRVPRLDVHGESSFALATALVNIASGVVKDTQHWHQPVARAARALNVRALCANVVHRQTDATRRFGDLCAQRERLEDALDRVALHRKQEARRHLRARSARIEHCRRRVCEPLLGHELVRLDRSVEVAFMDTDRDAHQHVLWALGDLAVHAQQIRLLERLETEKVILKITVVHDGCIKPLLVVHNNRVDVIGDERSLLAVARVDVLVQLIHDSGKRLLSHLVQVGD